jgi:hypothetical protein
MSTRSPVSSYLYAIGLLPGLLMSYCENSTAQSAPPLPPTNFQVVTGAPVTPPTPPPGIPPPSHQQPQAYFEWSYDLPIADNSTSSIQKELSLSLNQKVTVTCVTVSANNLPAGQILTGEIRFLSNIVGNPNPQMRVGLPTVISRFIS